MQADVDHWGSWINCSLQKGFSWMLRMNCYRRSSEVNKLSFSFCPAFLFPVFPPFYLSTLPLFLFLNKQPFSRIRSQLSKFRDNPLSGKSLTLSVLKIHMGLYLPLSFLCISCKNRKGILSSIPPLILRILSLQLYQDSYTLNHPTSFLLHIESFYCIFLISIQRNSLVSIFFKSYFDLISLFKILHQLTFLHHELLRVFYICCLFLHLSYLLMSLQTSHGFYHFNKMTLTKSMITSKLIYPMHICQYFIT